MDENAIIRHNLNGNTWYVVDRASDITNAEITAGLLRISGIPVLLLREAVGSAIPVMFGLGGVDVAVPEAYYTEAMALLDQDDDHSGELPPGEDA